eukprot:Phypoly_transcript_12155.p1 GENE.Phypoly_transcript_12155~~Phypoly_transcript_12155.p1  ORF type:complete len:331 (+),score=42.69 Phypoly_transcript_12155:133-1125(+)
MENNQELNELATLAKNITLLANNLAIKVSELESRGEKGKQPEIQDESPRQSRKVVMDVGGKRFTTTRDTLLSVEDTYFTALLSGHFQAEKDGSYFIDRNPKYFAIILEFLRTGQFSVSHLNREQIENLKIELDFYQISVDALHRVGLSFRNILTSIQISLVEQWSNRLMGQLLWKGSEHGFTAYQFHSHCDSKGPTLVVIRSTQGWIFGGYASVSWTSDGKYHGDGQSFLFTITNPHNMPPTKYVYKKALASAHTHTHSDICGKADNGPTFGAGHDLCIYNNCNLVKSSYFNFPSSYEDTTAYKSNTFTGSTNFIVQEVEVYQMLSKASV